MAVRERTRLLYHNIANDGINTWAMNVNCRSDGQICIRRSKAPVEACPGRSYKSNDSY